MALDSWNFGSPDFGSAFSSGGAMGGGLSSSVFSNIGGAVGDLYSAKGLRSKAKGNLLEAEQYDLAAAFARNNVQYTKNATEIKDYQLKRGIGLTLGQQSADVAASGFGAEGSALDLLRDSAAQGALARATLKMQGAIEAEGYEQQAKSYEIMARASRMAAAANEDAAGGMKWGSALKGASAGASMGATFGPWGAVIGGVAGGVAGYFSSE